MPVHFIKLERQANFAPLFNKIEFLSLSPTFIREVLESAELFYNRH